MNLTAGAGRTADRATGTTKSPRWGRIDFREQGWNHYFHRADRPFAGTDLLLSSAFIHLSIIRKLPSAHSEALKGAIVTPMVPVKKRIKFDPKIFLSTMDGGRKIVAFPRKQTIFVQGDSSDAVFYIQKGKIKLAVVSKNGKEATIGILNEGDFFGEGCLTGQPLRLCSATAMTECSAMKIEKKAMMEVLHREQTFSDLFVRDLMARNIGYE